MENNDILNENENVETETLSNTFIKLSKYERECFININDEDNVWTAETSIPKYWRKFEKMNWICTKVSYYADGTVCSKSFKSPNNKGIAIKDPLRKRDISDEQREKARVRLMTYHNSKNNDIDDESEDIYED